VEENNFALNTARALTERGYDVTILTSTPVNATRINDIFSIDLSIFKIMVKKMSFANLSEKILPGRLSRLKDS